MSLSRPLGRRALGRLEQLRSEVKLYDPGRWRVPAAAAPEPSSGGCRLTTIPRPELARYEFRRRQDCFPECEIHRCANGATLVLSPAPAAFASVSVLMNFGASAGGPQDEGAVHFLEHLLFKGTYNRRKEDIEAWVETHGARLDAYTTKEFVCYFGECLKDDVPGLLALVLDMLTNSILDTKAIEREKLTILRELEEVEKIPEEVLLDCIYDHCYDSALGKTILGSREAISAMHGAHLRAILKRFYIPKNLIVTVSGPADRDQILPLVASLSPSSFPAQSEEQGPLAGRPEIRAKGEPRVYVHCSPDSQVEKPVLYVARTAEGRDWSTSNYLLTVLARSMLQTRLREQQAAGATGACLPVPNAQVPSCLPKALQAGVDTCFDACHRGGGLVGTYRVELLEELSGVNEKVAAAAAASRRSIERALESFDAALLQQARSDLLTALAVTFRHPSSRNEELSRQLMADGDVASFEQLTRQAATVTLDTIRDFIRQTFLAPAAAVTALLVLPA